MGLACTRWLMRVARWTDDMDLAVIEQCESKVANLLASMDNLPDRDVDGKLRVLIQILEEQQREIEELKKR